MAAGGAVDGKQQRLFAGQPLLFMAAALRLPLLLSLLVLHFCWGHSCGRGRTRYMNGVHGAGCFYILWDCVRGGRIGRLAAPCFSTEAPSRMRRLSMSLPVRVRIADDISKGACVLAASITRFKFTLRAAIVFW